MDDARVLKRTLQIATGADDLVSAGRVPDADHVVRQTLHAWRQAAEDDYARHLASQGVRVPVGRSLVAHRAPSGRDLRDAAALLRHAQDQPGLTKREHDAALRLAAVAGKLDQAAARLRS